MNYRFTLTIFINDLVCNVEDLLLLKFYLSNNTICLYNEPHACPCGYFGDPARPCTCSSSSVTRYQKLRDMRPGESSADVRVRVEAARSLQRERFVDTNIASNADMRPAQIRKYCALDELYQLLMKTAVHQLQLTVRAYHRVLKLSRTIEDLAGSEAINQLNLADTPQYRLKLDLM